MTVAAPDRGDREAMASRVGVDASCGADLLPGGAVVACPAGGGDELAGPLEAVTDPNLGEPVGCGAVGNGVPQRRPCRPGDCVGDPDDALVVQRQGHRELNSWAATVRCFGVGLTSVAVLGEAGELFELASWAAYAVAPVLEDVLHVHVPAARGCPHLVRRRQHACEARAPLPA